MAKPCSSHNFQQIIETQPSSSGDQTRDHNTVPHQLFIGVMVTHVQHVSNTADMDLMKDVQEKHLELYKELKELFTLADENHDGTFMELLYRCFEFGVSKTSRCSGATSERHRSGIGVTSE